MAHDELIDLRFHWAIVHVWRNIGPLAIKAVPYLMQVLGWSIYAGVAQDAILAIGPGAVDAICQNIGSLEHAQTLGISLVAKLAKDSTHYIHQLLRDPNVSPVSRRQLVEELVKTDALTAGATAELEQLLQDPDGWVRFHAARAVFELGPAALEALSVISDLVGNSDETLDNAAREWLRTHGFPLR